MFIPTWDPDFFVIQSASQQKSLNPGFPEFTEYECKMMQLNSLGSCCQWLPSPGNVSFISHLSSCDIYERTLTSHNDHVSINDFLSTIKLNSLNVKGHATNKCVI